MTEQNKPTSEELYEALLPILMKYHTVAILPLIMAKDGDSDLHAFLDPRIPDDMRDKLVESMLESALAHVKSTNPEYPELYADKVKN